MKQSDVISILKNLGYEVKTEYRSNFDKWLEAYKNNIQGFHEYTEYNGTKQVSRKRLSLGLPKKACEDWADTLFNDNTFINVDVNDKEIVDKVLRKNNFRSQFNELIEKAYSLGTGSLVEFQDSKKSTVIDFVTVLNIWPLKNYNGEISDVAFVSEYDSNTLYVNVHKRKEDGSYIIENRFFKKDKINEEVIIEGILTEVKSKVKLFQIIKPALANNIDLNQPLGMSIYANAIHETKTADTAYTALNSEIHLGRMRVYLRGGAIAFNTVEFTDEKGKKDYRQVPIFDDEQEEFYLLPEDEEIAKNGKMIEVQTPELRVTSIIDSLQTNLNLFGRKVGLGDDYYSFKDGNVYTNTTSVISTNSKFYKTRMKHATALENSIVEMVKAIMWLEKGVEYDKEISVDFDDSIVEDTQAVFNQSLLLLNANIISQAEFFRRTEKLTDEQAKNFVAQMNKEQGVMEEDDPEDDELKEAK